MRPLSESRVRLSGEAWGSLFCDEHNQATLGPSDFPSPQKSRAEKRSAILRNLQNSKVDSSYSDPWTLILFGNGIMFATPQQPLPCLKSRRLFFHRLGMSTKTLTRGHAKINRRLFPEMVRDRPSCPHSKTALLPIFKTPLLGPYDQALKQLVEVLLLLFSMLLASDVVGTFHIGIGMIGGMELDKLS